MARLDLTVDPKSEYERKLMTAEQAAGLVESGDLVWIPSTHTPPAILAVLATRESELRDVTIRSVALPNMGWFRADSAAAWNLQVQYAIVPDNRKALADRVIDCHPLAMIREHKVRDTPRRGAPDRRPAAGRVAAQSAGLGVRRQLGVGRRHQRAPGQARDRRAERRDAAHVGRQLA